MSTKDGNPVYRQFSRYIIERCVRKSIQTRLFKNKRRKYDDLFVNKTQEYQITLGEMSGGYRRMVAAMADLGFSGNYEGYLE